VLLPQQDRVDAGLKVHHVQQIAVTRGGAGLSIRRHAKAFGCGIDLPGVAQCGPEIVPRQKVRGLHLQRRLVCLDRDIHRAAQLGGETEVEPSRGIDVKRRASEIVINLVASKRSETLGEELVNVARLAASAADSRKDLRIIRPKQCRATVRPGRCLYLAAGQSQITEGHPRLDALRIESGCLLERSGRILNTTRAAVQKSEIGVDGRVGRRRRRGAFEEFDRRTDLSCFLGDTRGKMQRGHIGGRFPEDMPA